MSKRFGRNQRRKMREEIGALSMSLDCSQKLQSDAVRATAEHRNRLETWARDIMELMGPDSAFNEQVRRMTIDDRYGDMGRLQLDPIVDFAPISRFDRAMPPMTVQTIITALIWRLHMSRDEFRPMIRIELENRFREPVGYALAEYHRWTERDVDYLSRMIAKEMVAFINKKRAA